MESQRAIVRVWLAGQADLNATFRALDRNGDGFISPFELARMVESDELCEAMMAMGDGDGDGKKRDDGSGGGDGNQQPPAPAPQPPPGSSPSDRGRQVTFTST